MRNLTITFLTIVFCLTSSIAFSETVKHSDLVKRNGIIYKKFTDVPFTGSAKGTNEFGYILKATYKNGKRDGSWEYYHENGQIEEKGTYKNGKKEGVWEEYYMNGQLWMKVPFKNGEEHGVMEEYDEDGQLKFKSFFKNGEYIRTD